MRVFAAHTRDWCNVGTGVRRKCADCADRSDWARNANPRVQENLVDGDRGIEQGDVF